MQTKIDVSYCYFLKTKSPVHLINLKVGNNAEYVFQS